MRAAAGQPPSSLLKPCDETSAGGGGALLRNRRAYPLRRHVLLVTRSQDEGPRVGNQRLSPPQEGALLSDGAEPGECCCARVTSANACFFLRRVSLLFRARESPRQRVLAKEPPRSGEPHPLHLTDARNDGDTSTVTGHPLSRSLEKRREMIRPRAKRRLPIHVACRTN